MSRWSDQRSNDLPAWTTCIEMANGDPLRAQEIFDNLSAEWWHRWVEWQNAKAKRKN